MLKAVIFDFDGVITDSEILHYRGFNEVLKTFDFQISKPDYYQKYLGLTDKDCFKTLIDEGHLPIRPAEIDGLVAKKKKIYQILAQTEGRIIEGVRPFLQMLARHDVALAICSGALQAEIEFILDDAKLRDYFVTMVAADHVTQGKPHPEGFQLTLERLNQTHGPLTGPECVVIEDSHWGLAAAQGADMKTIAVTNSYPAEQLSLADKIVARLDELTYDEVAGLCESEEPRD